MSDATKALAQAICTLDGSWSHHDRTDDHPCSACMIVASMHVANIKAEGLVEAAKEMRFHGICSDDEGGDSGYFHTFEPSHADWLDERAAELIREAQK